MSRNGVPPKSRRIVKFEILNFHRRREKAEIETADFRVHAGLRADVVFDDDAQNRIVATAGK